MLLSVNRPTTLRGEVTRQRILEATLDLIASDGMRSVNHRRVAREASASLGLITYYFESTESLIVAALERLTELEVNRLTALRVAAVGCAEDIDGLVRVLVDDVALRSYEARRDTLAGTALLLEIPRARVRRELFDSWEKAQIELYGSITAALGSSDPDADALYLAAFLDGLSLYAAITIEPDNLAQAAAVGLRRALTAIMSDSASIGGDEAP